MTTSPTRTRPWCLKHAGPTGHTGYELAAFQLFDAIMSDLDVSDSGGSA
ncbi:hypothetical protein [Streptomyces sp. VRA16 Mangrove soil]|nr:hypothetical protein [Streptomyces sp. VRA16 Mangrove soil]MBO1336299.1 hypothetical protein [Streptomyces sp. VRA16 Mangrove soil]